MYGRANMSMMRSLRQDPSITQQKLKPGTVRRIIGYAKPLPAISDPVPDRDRV